MFHQVVELSSTMAVRRFTDTMEMRHLRTSRPLCVGVLRLNHVGGPFLRDLFCVGNLEVDTVRLLSVPEDFPWDALGFIRA